MEIFRMMAGIYAANCLFVYNENDKKGFIVDPGGDYDDILYNINKIKLIPEFILLTHGHGDHIAAVDEVKNNFNIPVYCHENEVELLGDASINLSMQMPIKDVEIIPDKTFKEGDIIDDKYNIKIIHTPGHTGGSCCFLIDDILITGDTVFRGSIGRTDLPTSDYSEIVYSISKKIMKLDDKIKIYPGHGPESTLGFEKENNPYFLEFANLF